MRRRHLPLFIGTLLLVGCSTPPPEDHGQLRFEQKQARATDISDGERFP